MAKPLEDFKNTFSGHKLRTCLGHGIWGGGKQGRQGLGDRPSQGDQNLLLCGNFPTLTPVVFKRCP